MKALSAKDFEWLRAFADEYPSVMRAVEVLEEAQAIAREFASEDDPSLGEFPYCYYCHYIRDDGEFPPVLEHKPDCLWVRARRFCGEGT